MKIATTLPKKEIVYKWILTLRRLWELPVSCSITCCVGDYEIFIPDDEFKELGIAKIYDKTENRYTDEIEPIKLSQFFRENDTATLQKYYSLFLERIGLLSDRMAEIVNGELTSTAHEFHKWRQLQEQKREVILALAISNDYNISMDEALKRIQELRKKG